MPLENTAEKFGSLTKFLHWIIFMLFLLQYFLVYRREFLPNDTQEKMRYLLLHKSIGICVLILAAIMVYWRKIGVRPKNPSNMTSKEIIAAKYTHLLLYIVMFIMPISGILMSLYAGYAVSFFGFFNLPMLVSKNETIGGIFYQMHVFCSYFIIALVAFHAFAALYHHYVRKDDVLKRMI